MNHTKKIDLPHSLKVIIICSNLNTVCLILGAVSEVNNGGSLPTLVEKFLCLGNESRLMDCPHELIDGPHDCLHAGVTCLPIVTG